MSLTVSVVIPAYRASRTISRALDSLLAQARRPDEVLIIDDGSPDDMASAVAPYGDFVTLIRKPNGGAASARNLGIDRARGDLIGFLDADDYWEPDKLARQLAVFESHPEVGLVAARFYEETPGGPRRPHVDGEDRRGFGPLVEDQVIHPRGEDVFRVATRVWTSSVLIRREAIGALRFERGLEPAEDRDLWIRVLAGTAAYLDSAPLATAVLEPNSLSRSNVRTDFANMMRVLDRNAALLSPAARTRWEAVFYRLWAANHLGQGQYRSAVAPAFKRLVRTPLSVEAWYILSKALAYSILPERAASKSTAGVVPTHA